MQKGILLSHLKKLPKGADEWPTRKSGKTALADDDEDGFVIAGALFAVALFFECCETSRPSLHTLASSPSNTCMKSIEKFLLVRHFLLLKSGCMMAE